jgi:uncharacterized RDD family membrane protein YckC
MTGWHAPSRVPKVARMRDKLNSRLLPIAIAPAIMPAILLPVMLDNHVPAAVLGGIFGFFIALSIVAFIWVAKRSSNCARPNS